MKNLARHKRAVEANRIPSPALRREQLNRLGKLITDNAEKFVASIDEDFGGRARIETEMFELAPVMQAVRHARKNIRKWTKPRKKSTDLTFFPSRAEVRYEPLGVLGIISPWNYPVNLALSPLCDALAAGNRVMLKPSELTPATSDLLAELIPQYFENTEVSVITGGAEVAAQFSALPFDHLLFTGSTAVGRKVAKAAAENLVPTTLELGGKSPAILCEDYSVDKAAKSLAFGKFINAGQTCIAPDYVLAPKSMVIPLIDALKEVIRKSYPDLSAQEYSCIISERHLSRLRNMLEEAGKLGAKIHICGEVPSGKIAPTLITDMPENAALMQEEIFGPLLPVIGYDNLDHAVEIVREQEKPLALYCFTENAKNREKILGDLISGGATVNGTISHIAQENLPFGGVGPSGWGAYHGEEGFKRFSHARSIFRIRGINSIEIFGPPWGRLASKAVEFLIRR